MDVPPTRAYLVSERDLHNNSLTYSYHDPGGGLYLATIVANSGQFVNLGWQNSTDPAGFNYGRLATIVDNNQRQVRYTYQTLPPPFDYLGALASVVQPGNRTLTHHYIFDTTASTQDPSEVIPPWVMQIPSARLRTVLAFLRRNPSKIDIQLFGVDVNGVPRLRMAANTAKSMVFSQLTQPGLRTEQYASSAGGVDMVTSPVVGAPQRWHYGVDPAHRITQTVDPTGATQQFVFDSRHNVTDFTDENLQRSTLTWDTHRNLTSVRDALQRVTTMTYNGQDDLTSVVKPTVDGNFPKTIFTYNPSNRDLISVQDEENHVTQFRYDSAGHVVEKIGAMGQDWKQAFDSRGYLINRTAPGGATWQFQNDSRGNRILSTLPNNRTISYSFDVRDRMFGSNDGGSVSNTTFDANDLPLTSTDGLRRTTAYGYDEFMRIQNVTRPDGSRVSYTRNSYDNVLTMTNPRSAVTTYVYDTLQRVKSVTYPAPAGTESFVYNARGEMSSWKKTDGTQIDYTFDVVGNLKTLTSTGNSNFSATFSQDAQDRLLSMTDPSGTTSYEYTPASNVRSVTRPGNRKISYVWDASDRLTQSTDPENVVMNYGYTDRDQLRTVTAQASGNEPALTATYGYNDVGTLANMQYSGLPSAVSCSLSYDGRDRLIGKNYSSAGNPLLSMTWAFDVISRRTQMGMNFPQGRVARTFAYNTRDELTGSTSALTPATGPVVNTANSYALDTNHNHTQVNAASYTSNLADQTTAAGAIRNVFNGAGSTVSTQGGASNEVFSYDFKDQLTKYVSGSTTIDYTYNLNNELSERKLNGVSKTFLWDGGNLVKEYNANGTVDKRYFLGLEREAVFQGGRWHLLFGDHQGSVVGVASDRGTMEVTTLYSDFGAVTKQYKAFGAPEIDYGWTGCRMDKDSGHMYMHNRWYSPGLGKFLQRDPIRYQGGENMYAFGGGDSINGTDPSGLEFRINGNSYAYSPQAFMSQLEAMPDNSISQIDFLGHGGRNYQGISGYESSRDQGGIGTGDFNNVILYDQMGLTVRGLPFQPQIPGFQALLRRKLKYGANVNFFGCNVGLSENSVAASFSAAFPGTHVVASPEFVGSANTSLRHWGLPPYETSLTIANGFFGPYMVNPTKFGHYNLFENGRLVEKDTAVPHGYSRH